MLELRVLNGMQRGAALPLDGKEIRIGSADDNDVVLRAPGMQAHHALIMLDDGGEPLLRILTEPAPRAVPIRHGTQLDLAGVHLAFLEEDSPWTDDGRIAAGRPGEARPTTPGQRPCGKRVAALSPGRLCAGAAAIATLMMGLGWSAYAAITGEYESSLSLISEAAAAMPPETRTQEPEPGLASLAAEIESSAAAPRTPPEVMPQLPFGIAQIQAGTPAFVITEDRHQLFVNEEHRGFRLIAIEDHRLVFSGNGRVELAW